MRHRFWLKTVGISGFMALFFTGYFHLLRHPVEPPTTMPLTALDHAIGFQEWAALPYVSLWLYVGIVPGLFLRVRELLAYGAWAAAMSLAGLACFWLWPTAVPPWPGAAGADASGLMALLRGVDAAGNACPSLHVAAAVFSALWLQRLVPEIGAGAGAAALNWGWAALIVYSTLAIKQHVVLDVLAGALLGVVFAALSLSGRPRVAG